MIKASRSTDQRSTFRVPKIEWTSDLKHLEPYFRALFDASKASLRGVIRLNRPLNSTRVAFPLA